MTDTSDLTKVAQLILAGRVDDQLTVLATAMNARLVESASTFAWRLKFDDLDVLETEVTMDEWWEVEKATGKAWVGVVVNPNLNLADTRAVGKVLLVSRLGLSAEDAAARIGAMSPFEWVSKVLTAEHVAAPLDTRG